MTNIGIRGERKVVIVGWYLNRKKKLRNAGLLIII